MKQKRGWSMTSFASPIGALGIAFVVGRTVDDDDLALRVVGIVGYSFLALSLVALIAAFVRREKWRWLTLFPVMVLLALFGVGTSS